MTNFEEQLKVLFDTSEQVEVSEEYLIENLHLTELNDLEVERREMLLEETGHALLSTNWNFSDAPFNKSIHSIHPYPAKFIPQIPRRLIQLFHR